ncbi:hypothetical protein JOF29_006035 [Kribbella aluminosa]|uniref:YdhG-like domain-containing protein n=1 Tax=Kribbella aluminosa TaxID=416017 RepID=A0ABS4UTF2_9ACTN|nr:DUF1801 domain-containing protein [Kribbella aluminosa]MBP2354925.1 hypothetical protein [Kribbella aluminosa]
MTSTDIAAYLARIKSPKRRRDAETMLELINRATGEEPRIRSGLVAFGTYHYKYVSGREGDSAAAGFAARSAATTVYLADGVGAHSDLLDKLGPHTTGVGCLYLKDLTDVDLDVLEAIVRRSYQTLTAGTYPLRARETDHP